MGRIDADEAYVVACSVPDLNPIENIWHIIKIAILLGIIGYGCTYIRDTLGARDLGR